jgi:hypothetical protein
VPLKDSAFPYLQLVVQVAPLIWPVLPFPEASAVVEPLPSSSPYAASAVGPDPGGSNVTDALADEPFADAVTFALVVTLTTTALAGKLPLLDPAATVAVAGTLNEDPVALKLTLNPPAGAAALNAMVQAALPGVISDAGEQVNPLIVTGGVTPSVDPAPITVKRFPSARDPCVPVIGTVTDDEGAAARVRFTVATTPLGMAFAFIPAATQVIDPTAGAHVSDFCAALSDGPAVVLAEATSVVEYESIHCKAEGAVAPLSTRSRETTPPGVPEPDAKLNVVFCAKAEPPVSSQSRRTQLWRLGKLTSDMDRDPQAKLERSTFGTSRQY